MQTSISVVSSVALYIYQEEVKQLVYEAYQWVADYFTNKLIIQTEKNEKVIYSIKEELNQRFQQTLNKNEVTDGLLIPNYKIADGSYKIRYNNTNIHIVVTHEKIEIISYGSNINILRSFLNEIYQKHTATDNVVVFYILDKQSWGYPIFRRPRKIHNFSQDMQLFLNDVDNFFTSKEEKAYQQHSRPYKKGYLIEGAPGTGKTTVIEAVAMIHNMSIYMVNLNSAEMTDSVLINLIANVPPRSLIVFDEMDKQYEAIQKNQNIHLSTGGILNALDGPQRLSHGTIVVMIVNNLNKFDDDFRIPLLRPGRIDKVFQFTIVI